MARAKKYFGGPPIITDENLINYQRTDEELQLFLLYCGFSVGKSRRHAQTSLAALLDMGKGKLPFDRLRWLVTNDRLSQAVVDCRIGGMTRITGFLQDCASRHLDLRDGAVESYLDLHGIGLTKSRFFMLCTREGARYAVLDRHILQYLRDSGCPDVPKDPPKGLKAYVRLEAFFAMLADKAGESCAVHNLQNWTIRAQH